MAEKKKKGKAKKKKLPRTPMPEQDPKKRRRNWGEVPYGYTPEMARAEASRCLQCKKPKCIARCPVEVKIPEFIQLTADGKFIEAARKLKETNALPAVCGRVCPQETQCEIKCVTSKKAEPVAIGRLERFAADYERSQGKVEIPEIAPATGKRVAIVGSGPAGLTCAGDLIKLGHEVHIFEALHAPGGVLVYGIPEFRLPKAIVQAEVDYLIACGVKLHLNVVIGKMYTVLELMEEQNFDAVFIGTGAGAPAFMRIPGENLANIYSANEWLTRTNLMRAYEFPECDTPIHTGKVVCTIGGGNVAMDSARTALRLGAERSIVVYRRSRKEMPARDEEIHHAEEEGVEFHYLTAPVEYSSDEEGKVREMRCIRMELGKPDASGRRRPVPIENSEFPISCDTVVVAIGNLANPIVPETTPGLKINKWGNIEANGETCATSIPGVYAGGDIVTGAATVIEAMGAGKCAARAMHAYLTQKTLVSKLESSSNSDERWQAAFELGEIGQKTAILPLTRTLTLVDEDSRVRAMAARALGMINDQSTLEVLIKALENDSEPEVRKWAAWALGESKESKVISGPLWDAMKKDSDVTVCGFAALALGLVNEEDLPVNEVMEVLADEMYKIPESKLILAWRLGDEYVENKWLKNYSGYSLYLEDIRDMRFTDDTLMKFKLLVKARWGDLSVISKLIDDLPQFDPRLVSYQREIFSLLPQDFPRFDFYRATYDTRKAQAEEVKKWFGQNRKRISWDSENHNYCIT